eukprot:scaffold37153_cov43-Attheya_sp.AAC.4
MIVLSTLADLFWPPPVVHIDTAPVFLFGDLTICVRATWSRPTVGYAYARLLVQSVTHQFSKIVEPYYTSVSSVAPIRVRAR